MDVYHCYPTAPDLAAAAQARARFEREKNDG